MGVKLKKKLYHTIIEECVSTGDIDNLRGIAESYGTTIVCVRNYLYYGLKVDDIDLYNRYKFISTRQRLDECKVRTILDKATKLLNKDNDLKSIKYYLTKVGLDGISYNSLVCSDLYKNSDFIKSYNYLKVSNLDNKADLCREYIKLRLANKSVKEVEDILGIGYNKFKCCYKYISNYACRYKDVIELYNKLNKSKEDKYNLYHSIVEECVNRDEKLIDTCTRYKVKYNSVAKYISYALSGKDIELYDKYKLKNSVKNTKGITKVKDSSSNNKVNLKEGNEYMDNFSVKKVSVTEKNLVHVENYIKSTSSNLVEYCSYAGVNVDRLRRFINYKLATVDKDLYDRYKQKVGIKTVKHTL